VTHRAEPAVPAVTADMPHGRPGRLKVFVGAAPGVGKTYRMLDEAHRRTARGTDVVAGFVECHGRPHTEAMLDGLEIVPRAEREYQGTVFGEMDLDAVLSRAPQTVLVDDLAHTNVPGSHRAKRWQDVQDLLNAGVDVITTVGIQHLESLNDVVQKITGVPQSETVPDDLVRAADEIELVDLSAERLRRRMAHGNVCPLEKVDAAHANYFRAGNLTALRELALLWVAGQVDEALQDYRSEHRIGGVWETRERVVVALTGGPEGETLIRRAARIADRSAGGDLLAVHVARSDGLADSASPAALAKQRELVESLGGSYHSVVGDHIPTALLEFARAENATQLVLGTSRRGRLSRFLSGRGIGETVTELSGDILRGEQRVQALLDRTRQVFGMDSAELRRTAARPGTDQTDGKSPFTTDDGSRPSAADATTVEVPVGLDHVLVLRGRRLAASERRVLTAFAAHVSAALEHARLAEAAADVERVEAADRLRTALLAAVSHDLRTPLASGWAAVSSLRGRDVEFSDADRDELLATAEESLDKLNRLVDNLLDMSRLQAGALTLHLQPTAPADIVPIALDTLADTLVPVLTYGLEGCADVVADPPLLERVVANLVANATRHTPPGTPVLVTASALADRVELRVIDQGPGLREDDRDRIFEPFQRTGDTDNTTGLGLGLALSRGLTEAMGGSLTPEDTPGGGLTMVVSLPAAPALAEGVPA
jgi:K+-sensing histidine kinase KdpD